jgi:LysR family transcriptional activator of nhaA
MNTQLNYHHLRYFYAVALRGGVTGAAEALRVSAPTLSAQVRELEAFLGTELFHRQGRRMVLSETGRVLLRYAERIFSLGDELIEVVQRGKPGGPAAVFLGLADAVPKLLASRLLERACAEVAGLRVTVREGQPGELFPALAAHQLDIVIANEPPPASMKNVLPGVRIGRLGVRFAAAPALARKFGRRKSMVGFPFLSPARESVLRRELEQWWSASGGAPDIKAEFDDSAAMFELASGGLGAAPVHEPVLRDVCKRYGLTVLPIRPGIEDDLFLVTAERQYSHAGVEVLAKLARGILNIA